MGWFDLNVRSWQGREKMLQFEQHQGGNIVSNSEVLHQDNGQKPMKEKWQRCNILSLFDFFPTLHKKNCARCKYGCQEQGHPKTDNER